MLHDSEAATHRAGQQADACRRRDQREPLERDRHHACVRAAVDRDVNLVVLHRRVEVLLHDRRQAMNLIDEQHVA